MLTFYCDGSKLNMKFEKKLKKAYPAPAPATFFESGSDTLGYPVVRYLTGPAGLPRNNAQLAKRTMFSHRPENRSFFGSALLGPQVSNVVALVSVLVPQS